MQKSFSRVFALILVVSLMAVMGVMHPLSGAADEEEPVTILLNSGNGDITLNGFDSDAGYVYSRGGGATLTVPVTVALSGRYKMTVYMPFSEKGEHTITVNGTNKFVQTYADCNSWGQSVPMDVIVDLQSGVNSIVFVVGSSATTHMEKLVFEKIEDATPLGHPDMLISMPEDLTPEAYEGNTNPNSNYVYFRSEAVLTVPVTAMQSGRYKMTIYMFFSEKGKHIITINGGNKFIQTYANCNSWGQSVPMDVIVDLQAGVNSVALKAGAGATTHMDAIAFTKVDDTTPLERPDVFVSLPGDLTSEAYEGECRPDNGFLYFRAGGTLTVPVSAEQSGRYRMVLYLDFSQSGVHSITVNGGGLFIQTYANFNSWAAAGADEYTAYKTLRTNMIVDLQQGENTVVIAGNSGTTHMELLTFQKVDDETPLERPDVFIWMKKNSNAQIVGNSDVDFDDNSVLFQAQNDAQKPVLDVPVTVSKPGKYLMTVYLHYSLSGSQVLSVNGMPVKMLEYDNFTVGAWSSPLAGQMTAYRSVSKSFLIELQDVNENILRFERGSSYTITHMGLLTFQKMPDEYEEPEMNTVFKQETEPPVPLNAVNWSYEHQGLALGDFVLEKIPEFRPINKPEESGEADEDDEEYEDEEYEYDDEDEYEYDDNDEDGNDDEDDEDDADKSNVKKSSKSSSVKSSKPKADKVNSPGEEERPFPWYIPVIIGAVILAIGGAAVGFIMFKKKKMLNK